MADPNDLLNMIDQAQGIQRGGEAAQSGTRAEMESIVRDQGAPADWADRLSAAGFNPEHHFPGTTPEEAARIPEGIVYDPRTQQYRDMRRADAAMGGANRADSAVSGATQGVTLGAMDEMMGVLGQIEGGPAMANYRREQARARMENDQAANPGAFLAGEVTGGLAIPAGGAWLANGGRLARTAKAMGVGSLLGGAYEFNNAEGGAAERLAATPAGMVGGAIGGALSVPVGAAAAWAGRALGPGARAIFGNRRFYNNGRLTAEGERAIRAAGFDPAEVSERFTQHFVRNAERAIEPVQAGRAAQMEEFGIPAYRHNVTGEVADAAEFESARRSGLSPEAARMVGDAAERQTQAAGRAADDIASQFSGGQPFRQDDAATAIQGRLRQQEQEAITGARQAYQDLEAAGGGIRGTAVSGIGARLRGDMQNRRGPRLSDARTPNTVDAIDYVDEVFTGAERGVVSFNEIEDARQQLVRARSSAYRGSNSADQRGMDALMQSFDAEVENLIETSMMQGDPAVLDMARNARSLWSDYMTEFRGKDATSKFVQRMIDADASPDDVTTWLFSAGRLGSGRLNSTLATGLRDRLGADSPEWNMMRQAAFRQLAMQPDGSMKGPQAASSSIRRFFSDPRSASLSGVMFNARERGEMLRFASALEQMVPPPGAVNYSNTAYENARNAQRALQAVSGALGFAGTGGSPGGAAAGAMAMGALQGAGERATVRRVTQGVRPQPGPATPPVAAGAVGATSGLSPFLQALESRQ